MDRQKAIKEAIQQAARTRYPESTAVFLGSDKRPAVLIVYCCLGQTTIEITAKSWEELLRKLKDD